MSLESDGAPHIDQRRSVVSPGEALLLLLTLGYFVRIAYALAAAAFTVLVAWATISF